MTEATNAERVRATVEDETVALIYTFERFQSKHNCFVVAMVEIKSHGP
jgi:hypothetical protein